MRFTTKILATLVCLSLGFGGMPSQASTTNTKSESRGGALREMPDTRGAQSLVQDAGDKAANNDFEGGCKDVRAAINSRDFPTIDDFFKAAAHALLALCEIQDGENEKAWASFQLAEKYLPANMSYSEFSGIKITIASLTHHHREAVEAYLKLAVDSPETVGNFDVYEIDLLNEGTKQIDDHGVLRQKFLEALYNTDYKDPKGLASVSHFWFELFEIYVAQGKTDAAKALLPKFDTPELVIRMRSDKRYRAYAEADTAKFDYQKMVAAKTERDRLVMEAHPTLLEPIINYVGDLYDNGQWEQGLSLIDSAIQKAKLSPLDQPVFEDQDEQLNWAYNMKSSLIWVLGRFEEGRAAMVMSRDEAIQKRDERVSQVINLADTYCLLEQPQKALEDLNLYDELSANDFAKVAFRSVRLCAYSQLGDKQHAKEDLDYIIAHADDAFAIYISSMLTVNDQAGLAKSIIAHLDDPKTRNDALLKVQTYRHSQFETPYETTTRKRFEQVLARPDVRAAIEKYGYLETYASYNMYH